MNVLWIRARVPAVLTIALMLGFVSAIILARDWPDKARLFPFIVSVPSIVMLIIQLISDLRGPRSGKDELASVMDLPADKDMPLNVLLRRAGTTFAWIFALFGVIYLIGFLLAVPMYVFLYMFVQAREKWWSSAIAASSIVALEVFVFHYLLHVTWTEPIFGPPQELALRLLGG